MYSEFYLVVDNDEVIKYEDVKKTFENLSEDEKAEYDNDFEQFLACSMWFNGGELKPCNEKGEW